jgi:hypothetical protein
MLRTLSDLLHSKSLEVRTLRAEVLPLDNAFISFESLRVY